MEDGAQKAANIAKEEVSKLKLHGVPEDRKHHMWTEQIL